MFGHAEAVVDGALWVFYFLLIYLLRLFRLLWPHLACGVLVQGDLLHSESSVLLLLCSAVCAGLTD